MSAASMHEWLRVCKPEPQHDPAWVQPASLSTCLSCCSILPECNHQECSELVLVAARLRRHRPRSARAQGLGGHSCGHSCLWAALQHFMR